MVTIMNNELIKLVTVMECGEDKKGLGKERTEKEIEIFADVKSVGRTEYYEALRSGMDLKIIFTVNPDDFKLGDVISNNKKISASKVVYDDETFSIKRTYTSDMSSMELMCEKVE